MRHHRSSLLLSAALREQEGQVGDIPCHVGHATMFECSVASASMKITATTSKTGSYTTPFKQTEWFKTSRQESYMSVLYNNCTPSITFKEPVLQRLELPLILFGFNLKNVLISVTILKWKPRLVLLQTFTTSPFFFLFKMFSFRFWIIL